MSGVAMRSFVVVAFYMQVSLAWPDNWNCTIIISDAPMWGKPSDHEVQSSVGEYHYTLALHFTRSSINAE